MSCYGWVAERLNAPVLKTGKGASPSWVRIPPHPPKYSAKTTLLIQAAARLRQSSRKGARARFASTSLR